MLRLCCNLALGVTDKVTYRQGDRAINPYSADFFILFILTCNSADCRYCSLSQIFVQAEITSVSVGWG